MSRQMRLLIAACAALVLAVFAGACGGDDDDDGGEAAEGPPEQITMTLPFPDSIVWLGYEISQGPDGPFQVDANVTPETQAAEGNSLVAQQLVAGQIDFGVTGTPEIIIANARGDELIGLAAILSDVFTIVATTESGVTSLEDLEGETLGVSDLAGGERPLVNAALSDAGLEDSVELEPVGPGGARAVNSLESGAIAAYAGSIGDLVALEGAGLTFTEIVPEEFTDVPDDYLAVRPEVLEDEEQLQQMLSVMKAWFTGTVYGEQYPEDGLARICELIPEECEDEVFADGFYDVSLGIAIDEARSGGCPDYEKLEVSRDAIASAEIPEATEVDLEAVFPDEYCAEMTPDQEDVDAFAERTGATG